MLRLELAYLGQQVGVSIAGGPTQAGDLSHDVQEGNGFARREGRYSAGVEDVERGGDGVAGSRGAACYGRKLVPSVQIVA